MTDPGPDVWTVLVHQAAKNIGALIDFARQPGRWLRIIDARQPHRALWVGGQAPPSWQDDADSLYALHRRRLSQAHSRAHREVSP
jgi:D-alanyl-D-alanine dipeptidase